MEEATNRKARKAEYKASRPDAGVYRIVNTASGKTLIGTTANIASIENRVEFAKATNSAAALDQRLAPDIRAEGMGAFAFDVLERIEVTHEMTPESVRRDLAALEQLWREKLEPAPFY